MAYKLQAVIDGLDQFFDVILRKNLYLNLVHI
jgi:hypothetical protein